MRERLSLRLNEEKTRVVDAKAESFQFLGFRVQKVLNLKSGKWYPRVEPAPKSEQRVRDRMREITNRWTGGRAVGETIAEMNRVLRGWGACFHYGNPQRSMARINHYAEERLRKRLMRQRRGPGYTQYPTRKVYGELGLYRLPRARPADPAHA